MDQAVARPRLLVPGLRALPAGTERYPIAGGGGIVVSLAAGDTLQVIDPQGLQHCEIAAFDEQGVCNPGLIGGRDAKDAPGITTLLSSATEDARAVAAGLERRSIEFAGAKAIRLFEGESAPGEQSSFTAEARSVCVIAAPGGPMRVDEQNPPTDLVAFIHRAEIANNPIPAVPDPLADARYEYRIEPGTAHVYEVKAGEYIQIIDVEGRECSDFQCFSVSSEGWHVQWETVPSG